MNATELHTPQVIRILTIEYSGPNSGVWLYENTYCSQNPASYVDPGLSWDNTSTGDVLWGFRPSS
jgi:hypothetical protein